MSSYAGLESGGKYAGIDQGIDFTGSATIFAPASGTVSRWDANSGWPGGHVWVLTLDKAVEIGGRIYRAIYFAESFNPFKTKVGTHIDAGTAIGTFNSSYPGIEIGFADPSSGYPVAPKPAARPASQWTQAGQDFNDWITGAVKAATGGGGSPPAPPPPALSAACQKIVDEYNQGKIAWPAAQAAWKAAACKGQLQNSTAPGATKGTGSASSGAIPGPGEVAAGVWEQFTSWADALKGVLNAVYHFFQNIVSYLERFGLIVAGGLLVLFGLYLVGKASASGGSSNPAWTAAAQG